MPDQYIEQPLSPKDVLIVKKAEQPVHIMVLGVITNDGRIVYSFIFPHRFRFNMEAYIKYLMELLLSLIERVTAVKPYVWL